jgi:hypothetical protein
LYKHGPFSFDLRDQIGWMRSTRLLEWEVKSDFYGPSLRSGQLSPTLKRQFPVMPDRYSSQIDFVAERFGGKNVAALERLTTAIYVTVDENTPRQDRARYINQIKPHVSIPESDAAVVEADALLREANAQLPRARVADFTGCRQRGFVGFVGAIWEGFSKVPRSIRAFNSRKRMCPFLCPPRIEPLFAIASAPRASYGSVRGSL